MASRRVLRVIREAKAGVALAQLDLGRCYLTGGEGLPANLPAAYRWLALAADQGLDEAAGLIGAHVPPDLVDDPVRASKYYDHAAAQGCAISATVLARWRLEGRLPYPSLTTLDPLSALRQAAQAGHVEAQLELGKLALNGTLPAVDLSWLTVAAEAGCAEAWPLLIDDLWGRCGGEVWGNGELPGHPARLRSADEIEFARQALRWHTCLWAEGVAMPAEEIWRRACLLLLDRQRLALSWLERAAQAGVLKAACVLGLLYMGPSMVNGMACAGRASPSGRWLPRSYKQAERWLLVAANGHATLPGLPEAAFALWLLSHNRAYRQRDAVAGGRFLEQAAESGHGEACWALGRQAKQRGKMLEAAWFWLRAADRGQQQAAAGLAALAPEQSAPDADLLALAEAMREVDPVIALRLELGAEFGLAQHEFLLLDPRAADAGQFLSVDVRAAYAKSTPRLLRISRLAQRDVLDRARLALPPAKVMLPGEFQALRRRFLAICRKALLTVDGSALPAAHTPAFVVPGPRGKRGEPVLS